MNNPKGFVDEKIKTIQKNIGHARHLLSDLMEQTSRMQDCIGQTGDMGYAPNVAEDANRLQQVANEIACYAAQLKVAATFVPVDKENKE